MPYYDYSCNKCGVTFERKLPSDQFENPIKEECPECGCMDSVSYSPSFGSIGDPIKLGVTRPPDAFLHGVLGKMQNSVPVGTEVGMDGKTKVKYADFNKARYQPGRLV